MRCKVFCRRLKRCWLESLSMEWTKHIECASLTAKTPRAQPTRVPWYSQWSAGQCRDPGASDFVRSGITPVPLRPSPTAACRLPQAKACGYSDIRLKPPERWRCPSRSRTTISGSLTYGCHYVSGTSRGTPVLRRACMPCTGEPAFGVTSRRATRGFVQITLARALTSLLASGTETPCTRAERCPGRGC